MPIHDWTRVPAGLFHHFHQMWCGELIKALNRGPLPEGYSALIEQRSGTKELDLLAIEERYPQSKDDGGGTALLTKPKAKVVQKSEREYYADKASRIAIRHHLGKMVAFIEIVSPGNKHDVHSFESFCSQIVESIRARVHVLVVDLFPPSRRDPLGIHKAVWQSFEEDDPFKLDEKQNRVLAAYEADGVNTAYVETVGVGETLPPMPLFIAPGAHVLVPLEETYNRTWDDTPKSLRRLVEPQ